MNRPKIKIELDSTDKAISAVGFLAAITLILLPIYYYDSLPEIIPRHFGLDGKPDSFGGRELLWILPAVGLVLYLGLLILNKYPHIFNYLIEITEKNAKRQYTIATKMMRTLNTLIVCLIAYIIFATINTALGNQNGLGVYYTPLFLVLIFGNIGYYIFQSFKEK